MKIDPAGMESLLQALRAAAERAQGKPEAPAAAGAPSFHDVFAKALSGVNDAQLRAENLASAYARGEPGVELQDAMVALSKAQVSLQAAVQVRNKLVAAYHEIMNMPV